MIVSPPWGLEVQRFRDGGGYGITSLPSGRYAQGTRQTYLGTMFSVFGIAPRPTQKRSSVNSSLNTADLAGMRLHPYANRIIHGKHASLAQPARLPQLRGR